MVVVGSMLAIFIRQYGPAILRGRPHGAAGHQQSASGKLLVQVLSSVEVFSPGLESKFSAQVYGPGLCVSRAAVDDADGWDALTCGDDAGGWVEAAR